MPYLSLYRKYRPQTFAQVMGQDHVVQTLQNALRLGHVANGYLFCGTRGVAKTTIARILAKCLNCVGPDGSFDRPQAEPCNMCDFCRSIQAGQNIDVVEMDAASNRSVSDIAKLRESVQFGPMESRYKVYIVDEAHQLSSDAKDAFLKTLEEPPTNVVFVLATTEAHAIPITIASRCQQFDFRRGSVSQIAEQCSRVLAREQPDAAVPEDALVLVAQAAEGSYRDALSLLDQVLAYKRDGITAADVAAALGTVESKTLDTVLASVAAQDAAALFAEADDIYLRGKDVRQFLRALGSRVRDTLLVAAGAGKGSVSGSQALAGSFSPAVLVRLLEIVTEAERQTRTSDQHRLLLEMTLLKLAAAIAPLQESGGMRSAEVNAVPAKASRNGHSEAPRLEPRAVVVQNGVSNAESVPKTFQAESTAITPSADPVIEAEPVQSTQVSEKAVAVASVGAVTATSDVSPAGGDSEAMLLRLQGAWQEVIHHMQVRSPAGAAVVKDASPVAVEGTVIHLEFANKANKAMLENVKRREAVEKVVNKVLRVAEGTYRVRAVNASEAPASTPRVVDAQAELNRLTEPGAQPQYTTATLAERDESTPVLDEVISVFGGRIIE